MIEVPDIPMPEIVAVKLSPRTGPKRYAAARYQHAYIFCPLCGHSRLVHNQMPKGEPWLSLEETRTYNFLVGVGTFSPWTPCLFLKTSWCYACKLQAEQASG